MYFQQRSAILLDHDIKNNKFPYKHIWKQTTLSMDFQ